MGFLAKEVEFQRVQELDRQAEAEHARIARDAQDAAQGLLDEDKSYATEDNKAIIALLDSLPDMNFDEYLRIVAKHTGYSPRWVLYTRLTLYGEEERKILLEQDQVAGKLAEKGINLWTPIIYEGDSEETLVYRSPSIRHPKNSFCGDDIHPSSWFFFPITEPQEPGIGISFGKMVEQRERHLNPHQGLVTSTFSELYVRLIAPATAIITGSGERVNFTSLEAFDKGLERGFQNTHLRISQVTYNYRGIA